MVLFILQKCSNPRTSKMTLHVRNSILEKVTFKMQPFLCVSTWFVFSSLLRIVHICRMRITETLMLALAAAF